MLVKIAHKSRRASADCFFGLNAAPLPYTTPNDAPSAFLFSPEYVRNNAGQEMHPAQRATFSLPSLRGSQSFSSFSSPSKRSKSIEFGRFLRFLKSVLQNLSKATINNRRCVVLQRGMVNIYKRRFRPLHWGLTKLLIAASNNIGFKVSNTRYNSVHSVHSLCALRAAKYDKPRPN